jgi:hypothetical protein
LVCAKSWLTRAESISCAAFCFAASGAEDAEDVEPPVLGAATPAFRIGRPTADASAFLDYFCGGATRTDHAVLIDAPWGAGKTHFIKTHLEARDADARKADALIGAPFLYASLYGVSTLDGVREQFLAQAYPVLSSVPVKMLGTALAGVVKKWTGAEVDQEALKTLKPRLEAKVLVFDDLERAAMPLVDALGMINTFVEHGDHKVIVIANQKEIPPDQKDQYEKQREKVIGRTLAIRADPAAVLPKLIEEMRFEAAREAAKANSDLIVRLFEASETQNLRSLRAAIADFDRLVGALDDKLGACPEALRRLLSYITATEIEYRTGLTDRELKALMSVRISFGALRPSESPEIKKAESLQAKYPEVEWRDPIIPSDTLVNYLITGILDVETANQAILMHPLIAPARAVPPWRRLIDWQMRGAGAFKDDRAVVLEQLGKLEVLEPGEICHIAGIALWLEAMGAPLLDNVEEDIGRYVDAVEAAGKLKPNRSIFSDSGMNDAWAGYAFCFAEDPRFPRIKAHLGEAVERLFSDNMKAAAPALMEQLAKPDDEGEVLYDGAQDAGQYGGVAILHHVPVGDFADLMVQDGRANRHLNAALNRRYQYWGRDAEMLQERPWLEALKEELDRRAEALGPPFEKALKTAWQRTFNEMFGMLNFVANRHRPAPAEAVVDEVVEV